METSGTASIAPCATCGKSFTDFKKSGLFGCADCYTQFEAYLAKLFKRVQGVTEHVITQPVVPGDDLVLLEAELSKAVSCEDFEKAASIRDRLLILRSPGPSAP